MSKSCHANTCCSNCSPSQTLNLPWRESIKSIRFFMLFLGTTLFVLALFQKGSIFGLSLFVISYLLIGGEILKNAFISFKNGRMLDENFLMGVATLGAFSIGEYPEAVAVMIFFRVGEFFQDLALKRSRKSIANLMDIRPESATLITINGEKTTHPENITIGSHIIVKPGEKVPLDGVVVQGNSRLNLVALTGESMPRSVKPKDNIFSGSFNLEGALILETTETFANSTVSKILDLVENAATKKAKTEQFITRFAKFYTPFVVGIALLLATLPPLFIENALFSDWLHRSLVFLVVSCPCALVISIPLSFFAGIGAASREGILVKGGNYLEALSHVSRIVFDKTGTLTKGSFSIEKIIPVFEKESKKILELAFLAERYSTHPIAEAILKSQKKALSLKTKNHEELAGLGVKAEYENQILLVGNEALMKRFSVEVEKREGTAVYV
ncbi:MAG: HAD-IC family P-type ATPase, partial [Campylobacteraceae bacterium]|nr:HAD-IC family P-type ATPase [Campylobacteraceae bacterium]